jgi:hypothetical protein
MGYVFYESSRELRAILGVPGAAVFSEPMAIPRDVTQVHLAPGQPFALVERRESELALVPFAGTSLRDFVTVQGALRQPDLVEFSPTGVSLVLYSSTANRLQVISGLPAQPSVTRDVDLSNLAQTIRAVGISDDGGTVLVTSDSAVYDLVSPGVPQQLLSTSAAAVLAFFPNSRRAAIADSDAGLIYVWSGADSDAPVLLSSQMIGLGRMQASPDGSNLWITNPSAQSVLRLDSRSSDMETFPLETNPVLMLPMSYRETYLVSAQAGQPAWVLVKQEAGVVTVLVPAPQSRIPGHRNGEVE